MRSMRFLIIDDCPSRYDEFTRILDRERHRWVITCDPEIVSVLLEGSESIDGILLDHDMPHQDGRVWAKWIVQEWMQTPVIITSTTGLEGVREEMLETLRGSRFPSIINPADHISCEIEWLAWLKGVIAGMGKDETG